MSPVLAVGICALVTLHSRVLLSSGRIASPLLFFNPIFEGGGVGSRGRPRPRGRGPIGDIGDIGDIGVGDGVTRTRKRGLRKPRERTRVKGS